MSYIDSPEFKRQYNSASDTGVKLLSSILTTAFMGVINGIKAIFSQLFGK